MNRFEPHEHFRGRRFARLPHPEHGAGRHEHGFGRGGRLARFLEHGDLKMLVLHLIHEKPRHGYEIIKAVEDLTGGAYAPSPGVIYPTLTLLEELGHVESAADGAKKRFSITPAGAQALTAEQEAVNRLLAKIAGAQSRDIPAPVIRAMENLRMAMRLKLRGGEVPAELARKIADVLDEAARKVEDLA